jgi:hypothetical protein
MALAVAGATSAGVVSTFVVLGFARITSEGKAQQPESEETIRRDYEPDRTPKRSPSELNGYPPVRNY